jgi:hypothetical protein
MFHGEDDGPPALADCEKRKYRNQFFSPRQRETQNIKEDLVGKGFDSGHGEKRVAWSNFGSA